MQERFIACADLGTSKIALTVARINGFDVQVVYYRETPSDGVRYSSVFNPKRASVPLAAAVKAAEEELSIKISHLVVGLPRYEVRQESAPAKISRSNPDTCITQEEIDDLKNFALDSYQLDDMDSEEIYGAVVQSFSTDDMFQATETDVVGVTSRELEGNFKVFVGTHKSVSNIEMMMDMLGLRYTPYFLPEAVAHAVLSSEELDNGVALVELGAGVTSVTIYQNNTLRYYGSIPFGGKCITTDIKSECGFQERLAENLKLAYGACMPERLLSLGEKTIQINDDESGSYEQIPVKSLSEIIDARMREIITAILFMIQKSGYADRLRNGLVLCGGGANLTNCTNLFKEMSGYNVRTGYPRTRAIATSGFSGINEASAVASVGMILLAKESATLNCGEDIAPEQPEVEIKEKQTEPESSEPDIKKPETPVKPEKEKPAKPPRPKKTNFLVTWGEKIKDGAKSIFEDTIGESFDGLK